MIVAVVTTWAVTIGAARACSTAGSRQGAGRAEAATSRRSGSPPRCRSSWSKASICCSLTSTFSRSSISARPTRSRSIMPARGCWRSSPSSISPSPAPPRTSSPQYHVAGDQKRLASFFAETITLDVLAVARGLRADPRLRQAAAGAVRRQLRARLWRDVHSGGRHAGARRGRPGRTAAQHAGRAQAMRRRSMPPPSRINLVLCVVLIPRIGIEGAAVATSTALVVGIDRCSISSPSGGSASTCSSWAAQPTPKSRLLPQQPPDHLAGRRHRHVVDEGDLARIFVRRTAAS